MKWHDEALDDVLKDYGAFLKEFQRETDRGCALVGLALLDERLKETLYAFLADTRSAKNLIDGFGAPLGTLSARIKACHSLGLISEAEKRNLDILRKIRNEFAHASHGVTFESPPIARLCKTISARFALDGDFKTEKDRQEEAERLFGKKPRDVFVQGVITLSVYLMQRSQRVAAEKRVVKDWPFGIQT